MSFSFVQGAVNSASAATVSVALGSNVTSGNILVCATKTSVISGSPTVVVSSLSGQVLSWTQIIVPPATISTHFSGSLWYAPIGTTGAETVQAVWVLGAGTFSDIVVAEYSSTSGFGSPALDVSTSTPNAVASTTATTGTTATTAVANELVVAVIECWNTAQTWGAVSGYANRATASRNTVGLYDASVTSIGTQSFTVTIASDIYLGMIATFKSGATTSTDPPFILLQPVNNFTNTIVTV